MLQYVLTMESRLHHLAWPIRAGVVAGASLLVAGCGLFGSEADKAFAGLPDGPCQTNEGAYKTPDTCVAARATGKIALVYFTGTSDEEAKAIGEQAEQKLTGMSEGALTITISPLKATAVAEQRLADFVGDDKCAPDNSHSFAASVAAETMTELRSFDIITAMNPYPACDTNRLAATDTEKRRYADIFLEEDIPAQKAIDLEHEILHDFGLGHMGAAEHGSDIVDAAYQPSLEAEIQLDDYAKDGAEESTYLAYGQQGNVMAGHRGFNPMLELSTPQVQLLRNRRPNFIPAGGSLQPGQTVLLDQASEYVYIDLSKPLVLQGDASNPDNADASFNGLIIQPTFFDEQVTGFEVLLSNEANDLVLLEGAHIDQNHTDAKQSISYRQHTYAIDANGNNITVKAGTAK
jgi:hypothetical protein